MTSVQSQRGSADLAARRGPGSGGALGTASRDENSGRTFRRILGYLAPWRLHIITAAVLVVVSSVAALLAPWIQGVAIDNFISERDRVGLRSIVLVLVGVYLLAWVTSLMYSRLIARIAQRVMATMRQDLSARLQTLSMRFFDRNRTGDLMSRVTNDVDSVDQLLSQNLLAIFWAFVQIAALLTIMIVLDWRLTLAVLIPIPMSMFVVARIGKASGPRFGAYQGTIGRMNGIAEERLSGQRTVIAFDQQDQTEAEFAEVNEATRAQGIRAQTLTSIMMPFMFGIGNLSTVAVVGVGAWLAVGDYGVSIGLIASFVTYAGRVGQPLGRIAGTITSIYSALAGGTRVFELLDEEPDLPNKAGAPDLPPVKGRVVFDNVDFSYVEGEPILRNVSFVAEPGQMIGLVGPTGAGKSTIINVLNRFYDISSAAASPSMATTSATSPRTRCAVNWASCCNAPICSPTPCATTSSLARLDATDAEIEDAARLANADHFIRALPHGYDTIVSEGGNNLSLGQRQLLAIARAALSDPAAAGARRSHQLGRHSHRTCTSGGAAEFSWRAEPAS